MRFKLVEEVLEDNYYEDERDSLTSMYEFTSNLNEDARTQIEMKKAESKGPVLVSTQNHRFHSRMQFCLSGDFLNYDTKADVESVIEHRGGIIAKNVTKKVSYLIVGGQGSEDWKFGKYGRKVEKAMQYKSKGVAIEVIEESWLIEVLS